MKSVPIYGPSRRPGPEVTTRSGQAASVEHGRGTGSWGRRGPMVSGSANARTVAGPSGPVRFAKRACIIAFWADAENP
jgi:hypothetical protein